MNNKEWKGYSLDELKRRRICIGDNVAVKRNEYMQRIHSSVDFVTNFTPVGLVSKFMDGSLSVINLLKYFLMGWNLVKRIKRIISLIRKRNG